MYDKDGNTYNINIIDTLKMPDEELDKKLNDHLVNLFGDKNVKHDPDFYSYAKGDNPICLISHIDTLKRTTGKIGYASKNIIRDINRQDSEEKIKNKSKETKTKKYGDPYFTNREKAINTTKERYGVSNIMDIELYAEKALNTNRNGFVNTRT